MFSEFDRPSAEGDNVQINVDAIPSLQQLTRRFARERNPEQLENLALQIATEATVRRLDSFALVTAIAALTERRHSPQGVVGLQKIVDYFEDEELVFKTLLRHPKDEKRPRVISRQIVRAERNLQKYAQSQNLDDRLERQIFKIANLSDKYWKAYLANYDQHRNTSHLTPYPFSLDEALIKEFFDSGLVNKYIGVVVTILTPPEEQEVDRKEYQGTYLQTANVFAALESVSRHCRKRKLPDVLDVYSRKFDGLNLKSIHEMSLKGVDNEEQARRFSARVNHLLSNAPEGDVMWQQLIETLFVNMATENVNSQKGETLKGKSEHYWIAGLVAWQQQLADQLIAPEISEISKQELPKGFVRQNINPVMNRLVDFHPLTAGVMLQSAITRGVTKRSCITGASMAELSKQSAIFQLSQKISGLKEEDEMFYETFASLNPQMRFRINERLKELGDTSGLMRAAFKNTLEVDPESLDYVTSSVYYHWSTRHFGQSMTQGLIDHEPEMKDAINLILSGNYDLSASRWGEEIANVEVAVSNDSLARKLGIRYSLWSFPSDQRGKVNFVLTTNEPDVNVSGYADLDNGVIELRHLKFSDDYKYLETSTKLVAAAILHDILGRNIKHWHRSSAEINGDYQQTEHAKSTDKSLPKGWYRVKSNDLINDFAAGRPEKHEGGGRQKPAAYVSAHIRRVPYGAVIEAMIEKYNDPATPMTEKNTLLQNIRDLRDGRDPKGRKLAHPEAEKLASLPPAFYSEIKPVIDPDGRQLFTRTFVGPHFNPRLNPDDYESFVKLYNASYTTHGSSLAFLELTIAKLTGIDKDTLGE